MTLKLHLTGKKITLCCFAVLLIDHLFCQDPVLVLPVGHTSSVSTAAYSPDGKYIVTASWDNTAKIWESSDGKLLSELKGHTASLTSALFSPNAKYIVTTSKDSTARIWETSNGNFLHELKGHSDWISAACFSLDGKYIATASWDNTIKLWNVANGKLIHTFHGHTGPVNSVCFSKDGKYLLSASKDSTAKIWQVSNGRLLKTLRGHTNWVNSAVFSNDEKFILTASADSTARIWQNLSGHFLMKLAGHKSAVNTAVCSTDGKYILTASKDHTAKIWQTSNDHLLYTLQAHNDAVNTAVFSYDNKFIVTASKDNRAIVWQVSDGSIKKEFQEHSGSVNSAVFSPDGKYVLTASDDNTARIWNTSEGIISNELKGHTSVVTAATFSSDGKYMVTASWDNTAKIWNALDGKLLANLKGHTDWINEANFSPDGKYVVTSSSDNTAAIWSVPDGQLIRKLKGHTDWVSFAAFSPNEKYIVTTSWDNTARIWDASNGTLISEMKGHAAIIKSARFSPDNKLIVTSSWDNTAKTWNVENGKLIRDLNGHTGKIRTAIFSNDGKYILTASWDSTAKVWDAASGNLVLNLKGHMGPLNSATYSPDGKFIVTTSMDNTAKIWSVVSGQLISNLTGHTKPVITATYSPDGKFIVTASWDNTARLWSASGKLVKELKGHTASLRSATWSPDGKFIVTTSEDNTVKKWDGQTGNFLYTFFAVDSLDYLAIDKDGRYDGTPAARKMLYYVCDNEIVDLEQFKDLSWEPGLVSKLTGINKEPITAKKISEINLCNYIPVVIDKGIKNEAYQFQIISKNGGVGEVQLYVNSKLVEKFTSSSLSKLNNVYNLSFSKEKISDYLVPGQYNEVVVKATTREGTMLSRGAGHTVTSDRKKATDPDMYIISIGVSQYKGEDLKLVYASKDAVDFCSAVSIAAKKLLNSSGGEHVHTFLFNTETGSRRWPLKPALQKLVDSIARIARPEDIVVIFFAGHGVLLTGQKNLFLLTAEASSDALNGMESEVSISTDELKEWLRKIKANKQILIIDACNSGQIVEQLQQLIKREIPADQQRALESLKDKTGTYILAASAANQAAHESAAYDQGLLTYSLLSGIKLGGGLKDNKFIDVTKWFNFAADYVKSLAKNLGAGQDPQIIGNASFVVGLVDKEVIDGIKLSKEKEIFSRSIFIEDEELLNDDLEISGLVDKALNDLSQSGEQSPMVFVADNSLLDSYSIRGKYSITNNIVTAKISLFKGRKERLAQFDLSESVDKKNLLARAIVQKAVQYLQQSKK
jgi:WD40 repeat protein/uncharacterized caspase-like protein